MLIRAIFEKSARATAAEMAAYEPAGGLRETLDVVYGGAGARTSLDVFSPGADEDPRATVVWIHGGAWISGSKEDVRPYARMLAAEGYTAVAVSYGVAPESPYPSALAQVNAALGFLVARAREFRVDPARIVLAGDSAGANLASQLAVVTTRPDYAREVGVRPALQPEQLRGVVLNCGIYDVSDIPRAPGVTGWGFRIALRAYLGRGWQDSQGDRRMSTVDWVDENFPRAWISGGNGDTLTAGQSRPFAARLERLGVDVTTLFYPGDHVPSLPHEYQFHLDFEDARRAFDSTVAFLNRVTR
ncbi:lipase [Microbacterium album]|uniref:Lipase n=2 Tax=Microbacterium album TaxID=2053191 RepID=A0A917IHC3_9MICO|nr:lipase [Microbacterium album]